MQALVEEIKEYSKFQENRIESSVQRIFEDILFYLQSIPARSPGTAEKDEADFEVVKTLISKLHKELESADSQMRRKQAEVDRIDTEISLLMVDMREEVVAFEEACTEELEKLEMDYTSRIDSVRRLYLQEEKKLKEQMAALQG